MPPAGEPAMAFRDPDPAANPALAQAPETAIPPAAPAPRHLAPTASRSL
eukprot:CAMPEP_0173440056 /NCGR_PEP_ID=MMETSP1357-20121228/22181_1 /TAXON_ID=77926 /ORGANISM="Hemiselmis rufescens, Strain PCC563" /LENGTH=48 /DNA_ID= /DNA_START= /DNA_END= /DNA_ORIENTATION=